MLNNTVSLKLHNCHASSIPAPDGPHCWHAFGWTRRKHDIVAWGHMYLSDVYTSRGEGVDVIFSLAPYLWCFPTRVPAMLVMGFPATARQ